AGGPLAPRLGGERGEVEHGEVVDLGSGLGSVASAFLGLDGLACGLAGLGVEVAGVPRHGGLPGAGVAAGAVGWDGDVLVEQGAQGAETAGGDPGASGQEVRCGAADGAGDRGVGPAAGVQGVEGVVEPFGGHVGAVGGGGVGADGEDGLLGGGPDAP